MLCLVLLGASAASATHLDACGSLWSADKESRSCCKRSARDLISLGSCCTSADLSEAVPGATNSSAEPGVLPPSVASWQPTQPHLSAASRASVRLAARGPPDRPADGLLVARTIVLLI